MFHPKFLLLLTSLCAAQGTSYVESPAFAEQFEMIDVLDLGNRPRRLAQPQELQNSASKFLLEIYNEINEEQEPQEVLHQRHKRSLDDDILITREDRQEVANCNSILTFASRLQQKGEEEERRDQDLHITFNTADVPRDLLLMQAMLRIYKQPSAKMTSRQNLTVSIYRRLHSHQREPDTPPVYRILHSVNTTSGHKGWLEFNLTQTLRAWLLPNGLSSSSSSSRHELRISVSRSETELSARQFGLVAPAEQQQAASRSSLEPFIVAYFNGPELLVKVQKLRFKRELQKRKATLPSGHQMLQPPPPADLYRPPQSCERLNFTVDFKELQMHNWVIAPKKFEAYFCGGGCNFPLGTKMNATNHAIVQTLMHLKQPHLPKPCCVPTVLGSITILRYLNEDIIDLTKYQKAVAKECGCH